MTVIASLCGCPMGVAVAVSEAKWSISYGDVVVAGVKLAEADCSRSLKRDMMSSSLRSITLAWLLSHQYYCEF